MEALRKRPFRRGLSPSGRVVVMGLCAGGMVAEQRRFTFNLNRAADEVRDTMAFIPIRREGQG
jgi:hypothetical protein